MQQKKRVFKSSGVALFLTPVSVLAFSKLKSGKNDAAASLYGLFRHSGSAIGISMVNTMLVRNSQVHRAYLVQNLSNSSLVLTEAILKRSLFLQRFAGDSSNYANVRALGLLQKSVARQVDMLSYNDCFRLLMWVPLAISPLALMFAVERKDRLQNK